MKEYKYFHASDLNKETVGVVKAKDLQEAYIKASYKKDIEPIQFKMLFNIEEVI